jgi:hypothetical protein
MQICEKQVLHDNYYQMKFVMLYAWISLEKKRMDIIPNF